VHVVAGNLTQLGATVNHSMRLAAYVHCFPTKHPVNISKTLTPQLPHTTMASAPTNADRSPRSDAESKLCSHGMNARNLIVCIDGTANQFGEKVRVLVGYPVTLLANVVEKNTNVIELYNLILKKVEHNQRTWYNSGIGTYARPSWKSFKFYRQVLSQKIDLAIAWCVKWSLSISCCHFTSCSFRNFERTILAAYRWLSDNYEEGDCIFLFGALE